jgi:prenyltransferase beta subunit
MQGAQWGKLVKVQHCPATVTPLVKSDNPPFVTQKLRGKASWVPGIKFAGFLLPPIRVVVFNDLFTELVVFYCVRRKYMKLYKNLLLHLIFLAFLISFVPANNISAAPALEFQEDEAIDASVSMAFAYLATQINANGGIRWSDESSSVAATIRVFQALAAEGYSKERLMSDSGHRPIDFLRNQGISWVFQEEKEAPAFNVLRGGQLLTAIAAANENPRNFGEDSFDLIFQINEHYNPNTAVFGEATPESVLDQVWAIIGLSSNNANVPIDAINWLESAQQEDGSWDDGFGSLLDTTPLAMLALLGSNHTEIDSQSIQSGINFMEQNQQSDGGWQTEWDTSTNPNITGTMLQVISLLGQGPFDENWQKPDGNPITALIAVQQEDGSFGVNFGNAYSTADAITGLRSRDITSLGFLRGSAKAFDYLIDKQEPDGSWGSVGQTLDVLLALQAGGWQPNSVMNGGSRPLDFLAANLESYIQSGPDAVSKAILGISATGKDPTAFNDLDLGQRLMATYDETNQAFGDPENTWHQALATLALHAADMNIPEGVIDTLVSLQQEDGGWEYSLGFGTWSDNTALAIQALVAVGLPKEDETIVRALDFFRSNQNENGGWGDSSTTAYVLLALNALNEPIESWRTTSGRDPLYALFSYQKPNGVFVYNWDFPDDNLMSTATALLAIYDGDYVISAEDLMFTNQASIIVLPGDGEIYADCVEFEAELISGLELLQLSDFAYDNSEGFISGIMGVTNPNGGTKYWSYWRWNGRDWVFNKAGAFDTEVYSGTLQAWHFTSWETFPSQPPSFVPDINQICDGHILKNYVEQSYLDYNDLFNTPMEAITQADQNMESINPTFTIESTEKPSEATNELPEKTPENHGMNNSQSAQQDTAIILIASGGGIALILILIIALRKQK